MKTTIKRSNLRIIFSSIALISFVLFSLCDNLVVNEYTTYHTYGWRLEVINDLFLAVPFVGLLVFSIMERKMKHINRRVFVMGVFVLYLIQALFIWFSDGTSEFSVFCCDLWGRKSEFVSTLLIVRIVILLLIPIAHKIMLKTYSVGMMLLLGLSLLKVLTSDYYYMHHSLIENVIAVSIDILFHVALFFFSDLLDKENISILWLAFLGTLIYPIFGDVFEDDDDDEDMDFLDSIVYVNKNTKKHEGEDNLMSKYSKFFGDEVLKYIDSFEIGGDKFLLDPPENALLHVDLERHDGSVTVRGYFTHAFTEKQAARMLKKKRVLNKTFDDISLDAQADANIGVESIEKSGFVITLAAKTFDTKEDYVQLRAHILRFMDTITIIQNTESYE